MQAVLLAAGKGMRMRPLTLDRPKQLVEVAGKPLIDYVLEELPDSIDEIIIVVGYKADMIRDHLGESYKGKKIRYVHQWMPAGTAHALSLARPFLSGKFLVMNTDDIMGAEAIKEALQYDLAILVAPHDEPHKFGVVKVRENGTLEEIQEKPAEPASNLVSTGVMVLDERIFSYEAPCHENGEYYLTSPLESMIKEHDMHVVTQPVWIAVGCPEDIAVAEARLKEIEEQTEKG